MKYEVEVILTTYTKLNIEVEADNEDDADDKVSDLLNRGLSPGNTEFEVSDITELG